MLESVDASGNCLMLDAEYAAKGKPIMIFPKDHEKAAYNRATEFKRLVLQEYNGQTLKSFFMKQVPLGGASSLKDKHAVNALLLRSFL